jgi:hypothetical protein
MVDASEPQAPETTEAPVAPVPAAPRRASVMPMVAGGVLAAIIGFGAAQVLPIAGPQTDTSAIQAQLDAQSAELTSLKAAVAQLAEKPAPSADAGLTDRLSALEASVAAVSSQPDLSALKTRVDALDQITASLQSRPATAGQADTAALAALQAQIDTLKSGGIAAAALADATAAIDAKLAEAQAKVDGVRSEAEAIATASQKRAALHQIAAALDSGAPYASAIADLGETPVSPLLIDHAATGLPTLQSLRQAFPDAARAALDAALKANTGDSWTDRATAFLRGQTGARSLTPREGTDPDAVLSRAEAALTAGDLSTALSEIAALPSEGQTAMAEWIAMAQIRQDAAKDVQALLTAAAL